ncbi:MAG: hypothetical protein IKT94_01265 [Rikenellaceae bacterium]|nr:hypothetical protein [Rikenellaceae bacterium]
MFCAMASAAAQNLDSLLRNVRESDQSARLAMIELTRSDQLDIDAVLAAQAKIEEVDSTNQVIVARLLDSGWPQGLSEEANNAIWLVIDHAPIDYQLRYMPLIKEQVATGAISKSDYATLFDRVCMRQGAPQRYGTQTVQRRSTESNAPIYIWPIENPRKLNRLRRAMGLSPIKRYLQQVEKVYGAPCIYYPSLSVEDFE